MANGIEPANLEALVKRFREGRIVPFLGAGASAYTDPTAATAPPLGGRLILEMADKLGVRQHHSAFCEALRCPEAAAHAAAEACAGHAVACGRALVDLARVASVYQSKTTREDMETYLLDTFSKRVFKPNPLHELLATIAQTAPMLIITTNYDTMIEDAFDGKFSNEPPERGSPPVPYEVVATNVGRLVSGRSGRDRRVTRRAAAVGGVWHRYGGDRSTPFTLRPAREITCDLDARSMIYKIHGSLRPSENGGEPEGDFLIAEEDYVRFLDRMNGDEVVPTQIRTRLTQRRPNENGDADVLRSMLFLGYGLQDWNMRVLLDNLAIGKAGNSKEIHYFVDRSPNPLQQMVLEKKGTFSIHAMDLTDFVAKLDTCWRT